MPRYQRALILARSKDAALALANWPRSPFMPIPDIGDVGPLGGYVFGHRGLHKFVLGRVNKTFTLTVGWNLAFTDPARETTTFNIDSSDPNTVYRETRGAFLVPSLAASYTAMPHAASMSTGYPGPPSAEGEGAPITKYSPAPSRKGVPRSAWSGGSLFALIRSLASRAGVDPALPLAIAEMESGFNPNALSSAGAMGVMGLMPDTAKQLGVLDPWDAGQNISGGIALLKIYLNRYPDWVSIATAYRSGPGNLQSRGPNAHDRHYADVVRRFYWKYRNILDDALIAEGP